MTNLRWALALVLASAGCVDIGTDPGETGGPIVQFDPASSIVPFPNNLVLNRTTGKVDLPQQCAETAVQTQTRTLVLNTLDGFGTFKTGMRITLSAALDVPVAPASLSDNVFLYARTSGGAPVDPATAVPIPVVTIPGTTLQYTKDCSSSADVASLTIVPLRVLTQNTTYVVGITAGLTAGGVAVGPSSTWGLVRQATDPVTVDDQGNVISDRTPLDPNDPVELAQLQGLDLLWKAHATALAFLDGAGKPRDQLLLAWEFTTATVTTPLDPTVPGSLAALLPTTPLANVASITAGDTQGWLNLRLPNCAQVGCIDVGDVVSGDLTSPKYQIDTPNPLAGGLPVPGPWTDPVSPTMQSLDTLTVLAFIPAGAPPPSGWPTIVFGHGLTRSKETLIALAPQLARAGFASIAVDMVAHGARAIRISDDPLRACGGAPQPSAFPQCFAPIVSANLPGTRDNLRQTALDLQRLILATRACTGATCGAFTVDPARVGYVGQVLGGILGTVVAAESEGLQAAVTNVAAVGLIDVIENTDTVTLRCTLVDALIDAQVVVGAKWDPSAGTGICMTDDWKMQAGYKTFANIARWVLDPSDGANYTGKLATRTTLLQEVIGDALIPNEATDQLGALTGRTPSAAATYDGMAAPVASPAITTNPTTSKWVTYTTAPPAPPFPGNTYFTGSLLVPPGDPPYTLDGRLGVAQMQEDVITYLINNVAN